MQLSEGLLRRLVGISAVALILVLGLPVIGYGLVRWTVPSPSGALAIAGLSGGVEVVRDREAVPHIFATTLDDLHIGLGFTHAQDRLWQMELLRRSAAGRLSEIFGERTLDTDIFLRTLDLYGHAERSVAALPDNARAALEAYARGVNAFIARKPGAFETRLPPEFLFLGHAPEPWRPADSVAVVKMMALMLSANLRDEIKRLAYAARGLTPAEIADLMPAVSGTPGLPPVDEIIPLRRAASGELRARSATKQGFADASAGASNNWVVSGARTRSGKPLLANDPHLGLTAPSIWYLVHLALVEPDSSTANIVGASLPGTPLVVLGRSDTLAWGFTNTGADVQDLFIEKLHPAKPNEYLAPDGWRPFVVEEMRIVVRGSDPKLVERRRTRHGPVLPATYKGLRSLLADGHVAALQWTALSDEDTTIAAGLFDPQTRTVADYLERMRLYQVPMQSMVVADTSGAIAMIAPGRVPIRDPANLVAGRAPVPGWEEVYDWKGYIPFEELPRVVDPPKGVIATANARIPGIRDGLVLTWDWEPDSRQRRLDELIVARLAHDMDTMRQAQADVLSLDFRRLKSLMVAALHGAENVDRGVLAQLHVWDATMRADAAEPLIFTAWLRAALDAIYRDELEAAFGDFFDARSAESLSRLLEGRTARDWCDDVRSSGREDCPAVLAAALRVALADLEQRYGSDRTRWRWGSAHYALSEHRPFGQLEPFGGFFNVKVASAGGSDTLNRGQFRFSEEPPYVNRHAATLRAIYDFADLDSSLFIHATGQSGNPFSPFYRNFAERWARGEYITIPTDRRKIEEGAIGTWRLAPR
ncbi:MAG TPA: penicillin acylase family protein [Hyphomicrobiaceae bacterium]|nr:penicillin acylase family protein [Hyphomicrobiaceae bacterium]